MGGFQAIASIFDKYYIKFEDAFWLMWIILMIALPLIILFVRMLVQGRREAKVCKTSSLLVGLEDINLEYSHQFHEDIKLKHEWNRHLESKQKFDRYDCDKVIDEEVVKKIQGIEKDIDKVKENQNLYAAYLEKVHQLTSTITPEEAKRLHISYKTYRENEDRLFEKKILKPILDSEIVCIMKYSSPKGRNHYSKQKTYSILEISKRYDDVLKMIEAQNSEEYRRKRERAKLTPSLRYEILIRDRQRCKICGRSECDGVKLHVDHILPVAKGGKTEKSNLRTLCDECNIGKGSKIEELF